jgi:hypothetical protein
VKLLAEGRASEIFDLGDGRVLRRFKRGGDPGFEASVMEHARAHGYPVPAVLEVRDDGLVLERVDGADDERRGRPGAPPGGARPAPRATARDPVPGCDAAPP